MIDSVLFFFLFFYGKQIKYKHIINKHNIKKKTKKKKKKNKSV